MESRYYYELGAGWLPPFDWVEIEWEGRWREAVLLNGMDAEEYEEDEIDRICSHVNKPFKRVKKCPHCGWVLRQTRSHKEQEERLHDEPRRKYARLWVCQNCIYWQAYWKENWSVGYHADAAFYEEDLNEYFFLSKLRDFDVNLPEGVSSEFAQILRRKPNTWYDMPSKMFEQLVAEIFKANVGDCEVFHVGKPADGGVDVIYVEASGIQCLIQAKRRQSREAVEGVETVRSLIGAMTLEDASYGIIASTADHFSYQAYAAANRAGEKGLLIRLFDRGKLNRMLGPLLPERPWLSILGGLDNRIAESLDKRIPEYSGRGQLSFDFS